MAQLVRFYGGPWHGQERWLDDGYTIHHGVTAPIRITGSCTWIGNDGGDDESPLAREPKTHTYEPRQVVVQVTVPLSMTADDHHKAHEALREAIAKALPGIVAELPDPNSPDRN